MWPPSRRAVSSGSASTWGSDAMRHILEHQSTRTMRGAISIAAVGLLAACANSTVPDLNSASVSGFQQSPTGAAAGAIAVGMVRGARDNTAQHDVERRRVRPRRISRWASRRATSRSTSTGRSRATRSTSTCSGISSTPISARATPCSMPCRASRDLTAQQISAMAGFIQTMMAYRPHSARRHARHVRAADRGGRRAGRTGGAHRGQGHGVSAHLQSARLRADEPAGRRCRLLVRTAARLRGLQHAGDVPADQSRAARARRHPDEELGDRPHGSQGIVRQHTRSRSRSVPSSTTPRTPEMRPTSCSSRTTTWRTGSSARPNCRPMGRRSTTAS